MLISGRTINQRVYPFKWQPSPILLKGLTLVFGPSIHTTLKGIRPLEAAISQGNVRKVRKLLKQGADPELFNDNRTALQQAVLKNHLPILKSLIEKGADVNAINPFGKTALQDSLESGNLLASVELISKGAKLQEEWICHKTQAIQLALLLIEKDPESFFNEAGSFKFSCLNKWKNLARHHRENRSPLPVKKEKILSMDLFQLASLSVDWYLSNTQLILKEFGLELESERLLLAYKIAKIYPNYVLDSLPLFRLQKQKELSKLFLFLVKKDPKAVTECALSNIRELRAESLRAKVALKLATLSPSRYLENHRSFAIFNPKIRKLLLKKCQGTSFSIPSTLYLAKYISHAWGLKGSGILHTEENREITFHLEGWYKSNEFFLQMLLKSLHIFKRTLGYALIKEINSVTPYLKNAATKEEALDFLKNKRPCVFISGYKTHAISFTLVPQKLLIGDRGGFKNRFPGISIYQLPENEKKLATLLEHIEYGAKTFEEHQACMASLELKKIDHYPMKSQRVGNCCFVAIQTAFYALLCQMHSKESANVVYNKFTSYEKMRTLMTYSPHPDDGMWQQIQRKANKNIQFFERMHTLNLNVPSFGETSFDEFVATLEETKKRLKPNFPEESLFTQL